MKAPGGGFGSAGGGAFSGGGSVQSAGFGGFGSDQSPSKPGEWVRPSIFFNLENHFKLSLLMAY